YVRLWRLADMLNAPTNVRFLRARRTLTNGCLPISIYGYTPLLILRFRLQSDCNLRFVPSDLVINRYRANPNGQINLLQHVFRLASVIQDTKADAKKLRRGHII